MLLTRSIFRPRQPKDDLLISIMSRHTFDDGIWPDKRIDVALFDEWWPWLAPQGKLIGAFLRHEIDWYEYSFSYLEYLRLKRVEETRALIELALRQRVVLLCKEALPGDCHRKLLAEECQRQEPRLRVNVA